MEKRTKITNIVVIALAVTVVFMSIGFAAFTQQLNINGTATVEPATWKVQFDTTNSATTISSGSVTPTTETPIFMIALTTKPTSIPQNAPVFVTLLLHTLAIATGNHEQATIVAPRYVIQKI